MQVSSLSSLPPATAAITTAGPTSQQPFEALLQRHAATQETDREKAKKAAAGLVSQALILPILKQVRRSTMMAKGPFSPGIAEKTFGPEFDMQLADRIAHSPRMGVTKALTERLMKRTDTGFDVHG